MRRNQIRLLRPALGLMALAAAFAAGMPAMAGEVVMYKERVPSPGELADLLWPGQATAAQPGVRSRSLGATRAIRFDDQAAPEPAAPAAVPAPAAQTAAAPAAVADDASAPPVSTGFGFNIQFAFDSAEIQAASLPYLDQVGLMLQSPQAQGQAVLVLGHTDASGAEAYNEVLSQKRALAVRDYLVQAHSIAPERLQVAGLGERQPLPGTDPLDAQNRRVEFHAAP